MFFSNIFSDIILKATSLSISLIFEIRKFLKFFHILTIKEGSRLLFQYFQYLLDSTNFSLLKYTSKYIKIVQLSLFKIRNRHN